MVSSMLFTALEASNVEVGEVDDENLLSEPKLTLDECVETQALRYVGGFIARKFPEYSFLGNKMTEKNTWIAAISRIENALMTPTTIFFKQLLFMEKLFILYHGETLLKPEKDSVKKVSSQIC